MATSRDWIYEVLYDEDRIRWTVREVQEEAEVEVSRYTVRETLNSAVETGVLSHRENSPYWYLK